MAFSHYTMLLSPPLQRFMTKKRLSWGCYIVEIELTSLI